MSLYVILEAVGSDQAARFIECAGGDERGCEKAVPPKTHSSLWIWRPGGIRAETRERDSARSSQSFLVLISNHTHKMSLSFNTLDVFTNARYSGNPLAIVHVPAGLDLSQTRKQAIAREFNLSETVFLHPAVPGSPNVFPVDIFTADEELPFAGHPTVGSGWFLSQSHDL